MKSKIALCFCFLLSLLLVRAALADAKAPALPEGDLQVMAVQLRPNRAWDVYTGPGPDYASPNN